MTHSVLLVDDEKSVCNALKRTFRKTSYRVFQVTSGDQALELLAKAEVDVIISDQRMPGMNGTELLSIVKEKYPQVGRVMLSGYCDFAALTTAVNEANIFRFLSKPWNDEELLSVVDQTIAQQAPLPCPTLESLQQSQYIQIPQGLSPHTQAFQRRPLHAVNDLRDDLFKKQQQLEIDIKNDELALQSPLVANLEGQQEELHYFFMQWPRFESFKHEHIIDTAKEAGFLKDLYTWYILSCADYCHKHGLENQHVVIDIFCDEMIQDPALRSIILSIMRRPCHLVFRLPYEFIETTAIYDLLKETYISSSSIMLNIKKRIINVNQLRHTPVEYLEMDSNFNTIRNLSITEKRTKMLDDAQKLAIKTILAEVRDPEQRLYAKKLNVDFFNSKFYPYSSE